MSGVSPGNACARPERPKVRITVSGSHDPHGKAFTTPFVSGQALSGGDDSGFANPSVTEIRRLTVQGPGLLGGAAALAVAKRLPECSVVLWGRDEVQAEITHPPEGTRVRGSSWPCNVLQ